MLIVLRGNSGSGKSSTAVQLRNAALGHNARTKIAIVEQDYIRRHVLKEKEAEGTTNIDLIDQTVRFALSRGYHVILEGILAAERYGDMLKQLAKAADDSHFYYLDVPFAETLVRHRGKPNADEFGEKEMREWYKEKDPLLFADEDIISHKLDQQQVVRRILKQTGL